MSARRSDTYDAFLEVVIEMIAFVGFVVWAVGAALVLVLIAIGGFGLA